MLQAAFEAPISYDPYGSIIAVIFWRDPPGKVATLSFAICPHAKLPGRWRLHITHTGECAYQLADVLVHC